MVCVINVIGVVLWALGITGFDERGFKPFLFSSTLCFFCVSCLSDGTRFCVFPLLSFSLFVLWVKRVGLIVFLCYDSYHFLGYSFYILFISIMVDIFLLLIMLCFFFSTGIQLYCSALVYFLP